MIGVGTLLPRLPERFSVLRSGDRAQAWSFASKALTPFRWQALDDNLNWAADASIAKVGALSLIHMRHHGSDLHSHIPPTPDYFDVHFALSGEIALNLVGQGSRSLKTDLGLNALAGAIISPHMKTEMLIADGYEQFHVRIERVAIDSYLERTLQRPIVDSVRFDPNLNLASDSLRNWVRAVALLVDDLASDSDHSASHNEWNQLLINKLLRTQPNNYSEELQQRHGQRTLPRRVRKVVERIEAVPEDEYPLADLAAIMGVSPRSLQRDFQTYVGMTPRQYIERVRLARAHADLTAATGDTVADVAYRWGFGHVPRFAARYRERYGVAPSHTLRAVDSEQ